MKSRRIAALAATAAVLTGGCSSAPSIDVFRLSGRPSAVTVSGDVVWVADDENHSVRAIDTSSGKVIGDPVRLPRNPIALATGRGAVWVAHANGVVVRIDTRTRRADKPIETGGSVTGIAVSGGRVWAADLTTDSLIEIDASESRVVRVYRVRAGVVRVVAAGDVLWVSNRENTITRIDPRSGKVGPSVPVGSGPIGLAWDGRRVWVANSDDGTVSRIDSASGRRIGRDVRVGRGPIAVAALEGSVWAANQDAGTLAPVEADTGRVSGEAIVLRMHPRGVVATGGRLWAVGTNPSALTRVDP